MHCQICDAILTDFEATRRVQGTRIYFDLCNSCFKGLATNLPVAERKDLMTHRDFDVDLSTEGTEDVLYNNYRVHRSIEDIID
jgi:hypothetical protein